MPTIMDNSRNMLAKNLIIVETDPTAVGRFSPSSFTATEQIAPFQPTGK